ncbi:MAG: hypothetical protein QOG35_1628 [Solirubrobacteraceae bacterium]|jgi:hypothetical protein|nr:hypothetical protein [Solirubrobacteraceae bacterium]
MTTYGERVDALLARDDIAQPLDRAIDRLASALDPTDTDAGMEDVGNVIRARLRSVLADSAARKGWRLP